MRTILLLLAALLVSDLHAQRSKKKKDEEKEILVDVPLRKDPPSAVTAETARLRFHTSPLSDKGLLSQQTRDALKWIFGQTKGGQIVKIRALVAGTGDLRRVQTILSDTFTEKRQNLPALSVIQVGALPMTGAQVVMEAIIADRRPINPAGLAFFSGQQASTARRSIEQLQAAVRAAQIKPGALLRVTCFLSSLDEAQATRAALAAAFPTVSPTIAQLQRAPLEPLAECEAVGRLSAPPRSPVEFLNPQGLTQSPNYSQIALVNTPRVVISGTQMAFHDEEADIRLAFERLAKALEPMHAGLKDVVMSHTYPLTRPVAEKFRTVRFQFFDKSRPPASTLLLFEGLPSLDATVALEVIAAIP